MAELLLALHGRARSDAKALAIFGTLLIGSAWVFFGILEDVVTGDPLVQMDAAIYQTLQNLRANSLDSAMVFVTELGDTIVVFSVATAVLLWLAHMQAWRSVTFLLTAVAGASLLNTTIKVMLHRARPTELFYTGWSAYSFPSGHSTVNLVLYGFLALLIGRELRFAGRISIMTATSCFVLLVAFSRIYLGAHWFSDAVGGLAFGTGWLSVLSYVYLRHRIPPVRAKLLSVITLSALALAGGENIYLHHSVDMDRYSTAATPPS